MEEKRFIGVNVLSLKGHSTLPFDVYLMLRGKHVHYFRKADLIDAERFAKLEEKIQTLFILEDDEKVYSHFLNSNLERELQSLAGSPANIESVADLFQTNIEFVMESTFGSVPIHALKNSLPQLVRSVGVHGEKLVSAVLQKKNSQKNRARHAFVVACLSIHLAQKFNLVPLEIIESMALGALLHDSSHKELVAKPLNQMDSLELNKYQDHPRLAHEKFKDSKYIDEIAKTVVLQHEEMPDGRGYPKKLLSGQIDKAAYVVGLSNVLDRLLSFEEVAVDQLQRKMTGGQAELYPSKVLEHMINLLRKA